MKPVPHGEPYAGKLHVRFDEGAGVPYGGVPLYSTHDWWSKSGGATESLVNCLPCDAQGTFKRTDATTW